MHDRARGVESRINYNEMNKLEICTSLEVIILLAAEEESNWRTKPARDRFFEGLNFSSHHSFNSTTSLIIVN